MSGAQTQTSLRKRLVGLLQPSPSRSINFGLTFQPLPRRTTMRPHRIAATTLVASVYFSAWQPMHQSRCQTRL